VNRLTARLGEERGWALVTSLLVLGIMVSLSLPLLSLVDSQQHQAAGERKSESSFNLAEAAFDATVFTLANRWPAVLSTAHPASCTEISTDVKCPAPDVLERSYAGTDYSQRGWTVRVRDDVDGVDYYDADAFEAAAPVTWDANKNAKMWVRADAHASGRDRTIIALVRRQDQLEPFPRNSVTAGWFGTATNGNKVVVDTKGVAAQPAPVAVRCTSTVPPPSPGCLEYNSGRKQVSPDISYTGYAGDTAVPEETLDRFRAKARALDTYYESGCPQSPAGEMVFIETADCGFAGGGDANTENTPGMLVLAQGNLSFSGSMTYYGLVYAANGHHSKGSVVTVQGGATVRGSIAVDWGGGFTVGSNGENVVFDDRVFPLLKSYASAMAVQGTWRELPAS
jgi:type II secretory pathway pseudopilin PulG